MHIRTPKSSENFRSIIIICELNCLLRSRILHGMNFVEYIFARNLESPLYFACVWINRHCSVHWAMTMTFWNFRIFFLTRFIFALSLRLLKTIERTSIVFGQLAWKLVHFLVCSLWRILANGIIFCRDANG